jgi:hypothetical protein
MLPFCSPLTHRQRIRTDSDQTFFQLRRIGDGSSQISFGQVLIWLAEALPAEVKVLIVAERLSAA